MIVYVLFVYMLGVSFDVMFCSYISLYVKEPLWWCVCWCCSWVVSGQEFWEQQKQLEEQRERREKEKLEALKKKDKNEHSAVASNEVKRKLMVSQYHMH